MNLAKQEHCLVSGPKPIAIAWLVNAVKKLSHTGRSMTACLWTPETQHRTLAAVAYHRRGWGPGSELTASLADRCLDSEGLQLESSLLQVSPETQRA